MTELSIKHSDSLVQLEQSVANQLEIIKEMRQIKRDTVELEKRMINMVDRVTKEITINYEEQRKIQSTVSYKATEMVKIHLREDVSDNLFKAWKGQFTRLIYTKLKTYMNVVRYTAITREDFNKALDYITDIDYDDFRLSDLKPTPKIIEIMGLEGMFRIYG